MATLSSWYASAAWDAPAAEAPPSEWLNGYSDDVYEEIDSRFYAGELNGMDAGDVVSLAIKIQNELDNVVAQYFPSIIVNRQNRIDRRKAAMLRLFKWEQRKLNEAAESGRWKEVSDFAYAISDLSYRMSY